MIFPYTPCIPMQIKPIKACQGKGQALSFCESGWGTPRWSPLREWLCCPFSSPGLGSPCEFVSSQPQHRRHCLLVTGDQNMVEYSRPHLWHHFDITLMPNTKSLKIFILSSSPCPLNTGFIKKDAGGWKNRSQIARWHLLLHIWVWFLKILDYFICFCIEFLQGA